MSQNFKKNVSITIGIVILLIAVSSIMDALEQRQLFMEEMGEYGYEYYETDRFNSFLTVVPSIIGGLVWVVIFYAIFKRFKKVGGIKTLSTKSPLEILDNLSPQKFFFAALKNPQILNSMIAENTRNRDKILQEIAKFKKIKKIKETDQGELDILTQYLDGSSHWYRATKTADKISPKLLSLTRYS